MNIIKKISLLVFLIIVLTGCDIENNDMEDINIYTTTYPLNYLISSLYKDNGKVFSIYPTGVDINNYKISNRKLDEYSESDLFVFNSLDKDRDYAVKMINNNSKLKVIDVATGMDYENKIEELWLNPYNYLMMAENIREGLNEYIKNPYLAEQVDKNYKELDYNISKIDADLTETIENATYKTIIVDNDLFKYLEKYGLKVISLENDAKLSLNTKEEVIKLIKLRQIRYIYRTSKNNNNFINELIRDYQIQTIDINTMYSIDGGITNTNDDYLTIMKKNINLIKGELYKTNN
ncbi:MAG: zinc ABC transporter substrate-binding protein [Bacilli bacterium]|nr:zinc ABC transporter substrate-binding protein [Bacilli bacterium]